MLSIWSVAGLVFVYLAIVFMVAMFSSTRVKKASPYVYALALGIHCTSWAFFGTTTQAIQFGWAFVPTYLGVILVMIFGYSALLKIARVCQKHHISSLADYLGARYQHSNLLAGTVTLLCFVGVIPYIALQLDAITMIISLISIQSGGWSSSIGAYVSLLMALFAILFGARQLDLTQKHSALMVTLAFSSLIKVIALCFVGIYICYFLFDGIFDLLAKSFAEPTSRQIFYAESSIWVYLTHIVLGIASMFCLPRQFHVNFIEFNNEKELKTARWVLPCYLLLMSLFVLPIGLAGTLLFPDGQFSSDSFAISIPMSQGNMWGVISAFIGGLAASTSMVIVATLALGIMIANNFITPLWFFIKKSNIAQRGLSVDNILLIRQLSILVIIGIAYFYHVYVSQSASLVKTGSVAMSLLAQTFPAIIGAIYWRKASLKGVFGGMILGVSLWVIYLLYPSILAGFYFEDSPSDLALAAGFAISITVNIVTFVIVSLITNRHENPQFNDETKTSRGVTIEQLSKTFEQVIPNHSFTDDLLEQNTEFPNAQATASQLTRARQILSAHLGNASAKIVLDAISSSTSISKDDFGEWVEMATKSFKFNRELLQSSVNYLPQGIRLVDADLNLVAWNEKYEALFEYPDGYLQIGMKLQDILEFNSKRGILGLEGTIDDQDAIEKRLLLIKDKQSFKRVVTQSNGLTMEISGSPLPIGGYVTAFNDITEYMQIQKELERSKSELEQRVKYRTAELNEAKDEAERANLSKTKFLAAAGHDLMQPFNAASLFANLLHKQQVNEDDIKLSSGLIGALDNANELLSMLLDMTKLESGLIKPQPTLFMLDDLLAPLAHEFSMIAKQKGIELSYIQSSIWVHTDKQLLSRIIQNLLSNAVRYTQQGKIVLGIKRVSKTHFKLVVIDTGSGIPDDQLEFVFDEFKQVSTSNTGQGLGLGLTIVQKLSELLSIKIKIASELDKGTQFSLTMRRSESQLTKAMQERQVIQRSEQFSGKHVLLIENDALVTRAMSTLLQSWGMLVHHCASSNDLIRIESEKIDIAIIDYHLDFGENGISLFKQINKNMNPPVKGILITANRDESIQNLAANNDLIYMTKPIKEIVLKRSLNKLLKT
ncbi:PAS domain-containing hybrid sensor histidine kinase/response regulator [Glaciecola sp. KUL10]|uniref:PAS domain-containing hybrid sensor histidine kinase/response regulator n=1 Tax=Glaciecola sp. (strain KUL10) TaxID=2161813 RepID=UPI000D78B42F|nr:PAS domain-containing hybrid sensor histidine kinase/response regulator [Glaciecola sp. KUL10]GBL03400.1 multi-sensor hybrid histidine kinase [Glaciecola sp. KUL10]